jgi:4-amino-4-deoxy-L-arabinose transferase-like glycosyltransferase
MIRLILCFQQTSEIDNLTRVGAKYRGCVMCRFHVAAGAGSAPYQKPVSNNLQKWFLSPTGRLNFGFITEGKLTAVLITPSSWGSQLVRQHRTINKISGTVAGEKEDFCKGSLSLLTLYFVIVLLSFFTLFCLLLFIKNTKKLVPFIVVIFVGLLLSCFIMLSINGWFL